MAAEGIVGEYLALKRETEADLLAMQLGDFYEFFDEDAETVGRELDLKVSQKSSGGESYPMAGVPVDDVTPYLKQLVERGYRVAVADQHETDAGIERSISRVVTPGTLLATEDAAARYLAALVGTDEGFGAAFADVTTGRFYVTTVGDREDLLAECYRFDPVEVLPGPSLRGDRFRSLLRERTDATVTDHDEAAFAPGAARHAVRDQFGPETIESLGLEEPAVRAAGAVLAYVEETGIGVRGSMTRLQPYRPDDAVRLDATTQRNLELTEPLTDGTGTSLLDVLDHTVTAAGTRRLRAWLQRPRRDPERLGRRYACVEALAGDALAREALRETLAEAADLERLASRAVHGSADARTLRSAGETLRILPEIGERIESTPALAGSPLPEVLGRVDRDRVAALREHILGAIVEDPPGTVTEGGLFKPGYDERLDEVIEEHRAVEAWFDDLAERERRRHGLTHLQVDRNKTDGYYIQVGKSETDAVPETYEEIKTLKNARRYTTEALREHERRILRLEERRGELEHELFEDLRERVADAADLLQAVGRALATLDVYAGLAAHAAENRWTRPELIDAGGDTDGGGGARIEIEGGRHPVVEQTTEFVPNDAHLDGERRFLVVTGPNMSGKSTYMRQTALIVLLAQIGSFVPAEACRLAPVDAVFTRVGALDELAQGRSTFMVEMEELANILHAASGNSLVLLDEVGRGTATYDGLAIAWAATEYLHNEIGARTLFATHYHELTALADRLPGVANVHMAAEERDGDVAFLWSVAEGPADRSYGVHVADLAGVPAPVVDRAGEVLARLREEQAVDVRGAGATPGGDDAGAGDGETTQVVFDLGSGQFRGAANPDGGDPDPLDPAVESVIEALRALDVSETPPVELMAKVQEWQNRLPEDATR